MASNFDNIFSLREKLLQKITKISRQFIYLYNRLWNPAQLEMLNKLNYIQKSEEFYIEENKTVYRSKYGLLHCKT